MAIWRYTWYRQEGSRAVAMDIGKDLFPGPESISKAYGLSAYIECRLSDGLAALAGEGIPW